MIDFGNDETTVLPSTRKPAGPWCAGHTAHDHGEDHDRYGGERTRHPHVKSLIFILDGEGAAGDDWVILDVIGKMTAATGYVMGAVMHENWDRSSKMKEEQIEAGRQSGYARSSIDLAHGPHDAT